MTPGDGEWHPAGGVEMENLRPALRQLEPVVASIFELFNKYAMVQDARKDCVSLSVKQFGRKHQWLLRAALQRQIELQWPERYEVTLEDTDTRSASVRIATRR